ncbi:CLUMA_CG004317, isoform A [Clunio marinus]|uniref:CLUMA_CG004317, isoform A n=1 Tax=Clunio marinus TaxID=568069 RepID=A0A1J1HRE2_9DIPT|nr:CLUMA_CG004317, isoform A [Clunio marinus]
MLLIMVLDYTMQLVLVDVESQTEYSKNRFGMLACDKSPHYAERKIKQSNLLLFRFRNGLTSKPKPT